MKKFLIMIMLMLIVTAVTANQTMAADYNFGGVDPGSAKTFETVAAQTNPSEISDYYKPAAEYVIANKIFAGDGNGNYNWDSGLSRAELAVLLVRLCGDELKVNANTSKYIQACYFTDVPDWAKAYVGYCKEEGLMVGYSAYQFGSNDKVTPQQACTVILRYAKLPATEWSYETAVSSAISFGIAPNSGFESMTAVKRVEMASLIYEADSRDGITVPESIIQYPPSDDSPSGNYSNKFTLPDDLYYSDGSIGTLSISKLNVSAKVYEEESLENLAKGIGHFKSTSCWDGNVGFAAHNRGYGSYFGQIHTLKNGDKIVYTTKLGTRTYEVYSVVQVKETDLSKLGRSDENIITLITCVQDVPELRWCVQAKEVK